MAILTAGGGIDVKHKALNFFDNLINGSFGRFITNAYFIAFLITIVVFLLAKIIDPASLKFFLITFISIGIIMILHDNALVRSKEPDDDFPQDIKMTVMPRIGSDAESASGGAYHIPTLQVNANMGGNSGSKLTNILQHPQTADELLDVIQF